MARNNFAQAHCSVARALEVFGDPWTTLVLRDLLVGFEDFAEIQRNLGISSNVLADRLDRLVKKGMAQRTSADHHSRHGSYRLTAKGHDTLNVLLSLVAWGDRWEDDGAGPPTQLLHTTCGNPTVPVTCCSSCGGELRSEEITYHRGPGMAADRGTLLLSERLNDPLPE